MNVLDRCIILSTEKHSGQWYLGYNGFSDEPYIMHCLRVMNRVAQHKSCAEELMMIAVMHDLLEDTNTLPIEISQTGCSQDVLNSVQDLTRSKAVESYEQYINRIANSCWSTIYVKIADLEENLSRKPLRRELFRYRAALHQLTGGLG